MNKKNYFIKSYIFIFSVVLVTLTNAGNTDNLATPLKTSKIVANTVNHGIWKYGVLISQQNFIALQDSSWQLGTTVTINGEHYCITYQYNIKPFSLFTLNKPVEGIDDSTIQHYKNFEYPDLEISSAQLVTLYIPKLNNEPREADPTLFTAIPDIKDNTLIGFKKEDKNYPLDNAVKLNIFNKIQKQEKSNPIELNSGTTIMIDSEDEVNEALITLLDQLCTTVKAFPKNKFNVVIKIKWGFINFKAIYIQLNELLNKNNLIQIINDLNVTPGMYILFINNSNNEVRVQAKHINNTDLEIIESPLYFLLRIANGLSSTNKKVLINYSLAEYEKHLDSFEFLDELSANIIHLSKNFLPSINILNKIANKNPHVSYIIKQQDLIFKDILEETKKKSSLDAYNFAKLILSANQSQESTSFTDPCIINLKYIPELNKRVNIFIEKLIEVTKKDNFNIQLINNILKEFDQNITDKKLQNDLFQCIAEFKNIIHSNNEIIEIKTYLETLCTNILDMKPLILPYNNPLKTCFSIDAFSVWNELIKKIRTQDYETS